MTFEELLKTLGRHERITFSQGPFSDTIEVITSTWKDGQRYSICSSVLHSELGVTDPNLLTQVIPNDLQLLREQTK